MTQFDAQKWLEMHPNTSVATVALCDLNGVMRGKRVPFSQIEKILKGGIRMPLSACAVDIWGRDIEGSELVFESGDADGVCSVTERGAIPRSWTENPQPMFQVSMSHEDGTACGTDCRKALEAVTQRFREKGLTPVVATEMEFYLTKTSNGIPSSPQFSKNQRPFDRENVLSISDLDEASGFLDDVYAACAEMNIPADSAISEGGRGQFEINLLHCADPLEAADNALLFKEAVKGIARRHGHHATFMAKPFADQAGNGLHVHFSLLDEANNNVFNDGTDKGSDLLQHAVAGLIAAMRESTLIFAPHFNSYRRLRPGTHAPTGLAWGYENRTCAIRIPGGPASARRIEHRVAGADANPYLVIAAILGAALNGIESEMTPPSPLTGNAYDTDTEVLPTEFGAAIETFSNGPELQRIFDPLLLRLFAQTKQQELQHFLGIITEGEYHAYLETV